MNSKITGRTIARYNLPSDANAEFFPGQTYEGQMVIDGTVTVDEAAQVTVTMTIATVGDDTWYFNWHLTFAWADEVPRATQEVTGWKLSDENTSASADVTIPP